MIKKYYYSNDFIRYFGVTDKMFNKILKNYLSKFKNLIK